MMTTPTDARQALSSLRATVSALAEVVTELETAIQSGDRDSQDRLLGPEAVHLADGTSTSLTDLAATLHRDIDAVTTAAAQARDQIDDLASKRRALPNDLDSARALLDEIAHLIPAGQAALDEARTKILTPTGLLEPLFGAAVDSGAQALRPWLARLERSAQDGDWRSAVEGLENWRRVADGWLANARRVLTANRGPIIRRNELRDRLDAYRVKAGAAGVAEDPEVEAIYAAARAAINSAPCDLEAAADLVGLYSRAVKG